MTASRDGNGRPAAGPVQSRSARRFHLLPRKRATRLVVYVTLAIGYVALMWFVVFPWVDRTFVNQPSL